MLDKAYKELHEKFPMLLPIPKPSSIEGKNSLHYMPFEEAVGKPFTTEHQPSLQNWRRNNNVVTGEVAIGGRETMTTESKQNKIAQGKFIRGVVPCKDCMKPRCLYFVTSPNRMKPNPIDGAEEPTTTSI